MTEIKCVPLGKNIVQMNFDLWTKNNNLRLKFILKKAKVKI